MQNRVRELRKERKMRQTELAAKMNVSQQTISRIEKGDNLLPADILVNLAKYFGVSTDYILCVSDTRRTTEFQIEYNQITEKNYDLCRVYERLNSTSQDLLYKLAEELDTTQQRKNSQK